MRTNIHTTTPLRVRYTTFIDTLPVNDCGKFAYKSTFSGIDARRNGQVAIVDIYRELDNQYGGDSYLQRQNTEYISTGHYTPVNSGDSIVETRVFGGDICLSLFQEKKLISYVTGGYTSPVIGKIYPVQTIANTELRNGYHLNNLIDTTNSTASNTRRETEDEYSIPSLYHKEKTLQTYTTEGTNSLISEYDNRIYVSEVKSNGEFSDSWTIFKPLNYLDVDGHYGPINRITVFNDRLLFFQDKAFGEILLNPVTTITDIDGGETQLGTGKGLVSYKYISNTTGSKHQWGVLNTGNLVYFFDANLKKFQRVVNSKENLSDVKGMSSFFYNEITGSVLNNDTPLNFNGITSVYDHRFGDAIFTFHTTKLNENITKAYTTIFNERINEFVGFYPFAPRHYFTDNKRIFAQNYKNVYINNRVTSSIQDYKIHVFDEGNRGEFFGKDSLSTLTIVVNPEGNWSKIFNNIEFLTQVQDSNGADIPLETFNYFKAYNEYQDTGTITLVPQSNIRRRMRNWRMVIPRDATTASINILPRMRNPYLLETFEFLNNNNKRIVINDIFNFYTDSPL